MQSDVGVAETAVGAVAADRVRLPTDRRRHYLTRRARSGEVAELDDLVIMSTNMHTCSVTKALRAPEVA